MDFVKTMETLKMWLTYLKITNQKNRLVNFQPSPYVQPSQAKSSIIFNI